MIQNLVFRIPRLTTILLPPEAPVALTERQLSAARALDDLHFHKSVILYVLDTTEDDLADVLGTANRTLLFELAWQIWARGGWATSPIDEPINVLTNIERWRLVQALEEVLEVETITNAVRGEIVKLQQLKWTCGSDTPSSDVRPLWCFLFPKPTDPTPGVNLRDLILDPWTRLTFGDRIMLVESMARGWIMRYANPDGYSMSYKYKLDPIYGFTGDLLGDDFRRFEEDIQLWLRDTHGNQALRECWAPQIRTLQEYVGQQLGLPAFRGE